MKKLLFFTFVIVCLMGAGRAFAYTVPENDTGVEFLYVTGPKGDPLRGAEDHVQVLDIDVPENEQEKLVIAIFDPETGGNIDARPFSDNPWDTITEIIVSGGEGEIYKKVFKSGKFDNKFFSFEPLSITDGVKVGSYYRFTLTITATEGDDANLFKVRVSPNSAKVSSPNITFRLVPEEGKVMHFYPLIPNGVDQIIVSSYDLDYDGGTSTLHDVANNMEYDIEASESGQWHDTVISLSSTNERFIDYKIVKGTQYKAHAALKITDIDGNPFPIYFRRRNLGNCDEFTFDGTSSFDPDDQALTYHWDFGDGTTSDEPIVIHQFPKGGDFNVILSVQDTSGLHCDTAVSSQVVSVNTPPVADFTGPGISCTDQTLTFDASNSTDNTPDQLSYQWDFGDGTGAEGKQVTKVFTRGGTYNVNLTVNDNSETTCNTDSVNSMITINTMPVADAGKDINLCLEHNQDYYISFNGSGSTDADGNALTYRWDFGDGSSDSGSSVTHVYQKRGEYVATLFVDDGYNSACSSSTDTLKVKLNKAPVAVVGDNVTVCLGTEVTFDGSGSIGEEGEALQYEWDLGDGTIENGVIVTHTYQSGGSYKAILTVNDMQNSNCSISTDSMYVTVNTSPSADFSGVNTACTGDELLFDASGTSDVDGDNLTYAWDFGDGTDLQGGSNVAHVYGKGGNYAVRLTIDDNKGTECSQDISVLNVVINTPPAAVFNAVKVACTGDVVSFDATGSNDADGDKLAYTWDFGDGSELQVGSNVTHVYNNGGDYFVRLTVDDNKGTKCSTNTATTYVTVNTSPSAVLKATRLACTGDEVSFDASGSNDADGDKMTYTWNFGDGTTVQGGSQASHVYNKGGDYSVRLVADDNKGTKCSQDATGVSVRINTPPVADAGPNLVCCLEQISEFDGSNSYDADGDNLTYTWDFGDGSTGEGARVSHVYSTIGRFVITLTVNDNSGTSCDTASDSFHATVNAKPTSIIIVK